MTSRNLLGISLDAVVADKASVSKLIAAAERNIADAQLQGLSSGNQADDGLGLPRHLRLGVKAEHALRATQKLISTASAALASTQP